MEPMVPASQLQSVPRGRNWHQTLDRAWSSEAARREFEEATGFSPLASAEAELREQIDAGYFDAYREAFSIWVTRCLDLAEQAPSAVRAAMTD